MCAKAAVATASKSDAVRDYFKSHPEASVKDAAEALAADGLKVSVALINKIKYTKPKSKRGKKKPGRKPAAAAGNGTSKAQAIRDAFNKLGAKSRPRDVMAHLKEAGVVVSAAQVSGVRKTLRKRGRPAKVAAVSIGKVNGGLSLEHLLAAKKLVDQLGLESAKRALDALSKLSS